MFLLKWFKKRNRTTKTQNIFINTEVENSYENKIAEFDKKCGLLLQKNLIERSRYFRDRMYYALSESKTC